MSIVKTGLFIEDIEVTSEHIGKEIDIVHPWGDFRDPKANTYKIIDVDADGTFKVCQYGQLGGVTDYHWVSKEATGDNGDIDYWEWVDRSMAKPKVTSTKPQRQKLAKAIKEAKVALDSAIQEAEEVGMHVEIRHGKVIKITFNPPVEEY